jgi:hypothetical protein
LTSRGVDGDLSLKIVAPLIGDAGAAAVHDDAVIKELPSDGMLTC